MVPVLTKRMEYKRTNVDEEQNRRCYDDGPPTIPYYEQPVDLPRHLSSTFGGDWHEERTINPSPINVWVA